LFNKLFSLSIKNREPHPVFRFDILSSVVGSNWLCKVRGGEGQRQTIHPSEYSNKKFIQISSLRAWSKSCILPTKIKVKASLQEEKPQIVIGLCVYISWNNYIIHGLGELG
jgi:hypothetical protein